MDGEILVHLSEVPRCTTLDGGAGFLPVVPDMRFSGAFLAVSYPFNVSLTDGQSGLTMLCQSIGAAAGGARSCFNSQE